VVRPSFYAPRRDNAAQPQQSANANHWKGGGMSRRLPGMYSPVLG
jgi:hypothetical protein